MAISFKTLTQKDRTQSRTLLHESIPITGTLVSGTYNLQSNLLREDNIKTFSHGMFQSVYDYPYASSSANHIFDISAGFSSTHTGSLSASAATNTISQVSKKVNIYNQMAQVLCGYDTNSTVRPFDADGDLSGDGGIKHSNAIFLNFSRLLVKDEIKKGSFSLELGTGSIEVEAGAHTAFAGGVKTITDTGSLTSYKVNSPAGEYGILKENITGENVGLIYYQAGIAVLTSSIFNSGVNNSVHTLMTTGAGGDSAVGLLTGSTIDVFADAIRRRIKNVSFNNTTELNSSIFFCRANHDEFNYSSNPTYLTGSKIRVKAGQSGNEALNPPSAYVTSVGLYSPDNKLLAVAKLSEPLRKDPTNELTLRVRLDY